VSVEGKRLPVGGYYTFGRENIDETPHNILKEVHSMGKVETWYAGGKQVLKRIHKAMKSMGLEIHRPTAAPHLYMVAYEVIIPKGDGDEVSTDDLKVRIWQWGEPIMTVPLREVVEDVSRVADKLDEKLERKWPLEKIEETVTKWNKRFKTSMARNTSSRKKKRRVPRKRRIRR